MPLLGTFCDLALELMGLAPRGGPRSGEPSESPPFCRSCPRFGRGTADLRTEEDDVSRECPLTLLRLEELPPSPGLAKWLLALSVVKGTDKWLLGLSDVRVAARWLLGLSVVSIAPAMPGTPKLPLGDPSCEELSAESTVASELNLFRTALETRIFLVPGELPALFCADELGEAEEALPELAVVRVWKAGEAFPVPSLAREDSSDS